MNAAHSFLRATVRGAFELTVRLLTLLEINEYGSQKQKKRRRLWFLEGLICLPVQVPSPSLAGRTTPPRPSGFRHLVCELTKGLSTISHASQYDSNRTDQSRIFVSVYYYLHDRFHSLPIVLKYF